MLQRRLILSKNREISTFLNTKYKTRLSQRLADCISQMSHSVDMSDGEEITQSNR